MDYAALASAGTTLLKGAGIPVVINRGGVKLTAGFGVFTKSKDKNETSSSSSLLAQTSIRNKTLLLNAVTKVPAVNDTAVIARATYTITSVEAISPGSVAVLYRLELA